jgi:hypothetical protein
MDQIWVGVIIAIVFGPALLQVLFPASARSARVRFIFGGVQLIFGVAVGGILYASGHVWPWSFMVAIVGIYNLWVASQLRAQFRIPI